MNPAVWEMGNDLIVDCPVRIFGDSPHDFLFHLADV
jgi:hypothetical protein